MYLMKMKIMDPNKGLRVMVSSGKAGRRMKAPLSVGEALFGP